MLPWWPLGSFHTVGVSSISSAGDSGLWNHLGLDLTPQASYWTPRVKTGLLFCILQVLSFLRLESFHLFLSKPKDMLIDFRKRGRETSMWERNISWLPLVHIPTRGLNLQPKHGPWPGINHTAFLGLRKMLQPTEPHWPGLTRFCVFFLRMPWCSVCAELEHEKCYFSFLPYQLLFAYVEFESFLKSHI